MILIIICNIISSGDSMIIRHKDLRKKGYSSYQIKKLVDNKQLFFLKKGIYSTDLNTNYFEIIAKKHPNAIFTSDSVYYYYDLTDVILNYFYLATKRSNSRIN